MFYSKLNNVFHFLTNITDYNSFRLLNCDTFLPDLLFPLLYQVHQNLIEVVLVVVRPGVLLFRRLHLLLVRGAGDVTGILS